MILKQIIDNAGYINEVELRQLAEEFPNMPLVIKWGCSPRSIHPACEVEDAIKNKLKDENEYVREVFVGCGNMDKLREALGMPDE